MINVIVKCVHKKPLLLHNVDLANPLNPWARKMADLRGTPSKRRTDKWFEDMAKAQFMGAFYGNDPDKDGIIIPSDNVLRSIVGGARATRRGPTVLRALSMTETAVPIIYDGPKTRDELWNNGFYLTKMIRGTGGASPTTWPKFDDWAVSVPFQLDEQILNFNDLQEIVAQAGRVEGLGASRKQGMGRYDGLVQLVQKS